MTYRGDEEQMREMERRHQEEVEAQERAEVRARREASDTRAAQLARAEQRRAQEKLQRAQEDWRTWEPDRPNRSSPSVEKDWVTYRYRGTSPESKWPEWARQLGLTAIAVLALAALAVWLYLVALH